MISGRVYVYVYVYTRSSCRRNRLRKSRKSSRSRRGFSEKLFFSFSNGNSHPFPRVDIYMRYACARTCYSVHIASHDCTARFRNRDIGKGDWKQVEGGRWKICKRPEFFLFKSQSRRNGKTVVFHNPSVLACERNQFYNIVWFFLTANKFSGK